MRYIVSPTETGYFNRTNSRAPNTCDVARAPPSCSVVSWELDQPRSATHNAVIPPPRHIVLCRKHRIRLHPRADLQISLPLLRLGYPLDQRIPPPQHLDQVPPRDLLLDPAHHPRCRKADLVPHPRSIVHHREVVLMLKSRKPSLGHHLAKVAVRPPAVDLAGMGHPPAKVSSAPLHRVTLADQSRGHAADHRLPGLCRRRQVKVDTCREFEAQFHWRIHQSCQSNCFHNPVSSYPYS